MIKGVYKVIAATRDVRHLKGMVAKPSTPVTLEGMKGSAAGFSDALIGEICAAKGARAVVTFDKTAAKLPSFELLSWPS